MLGYDAHPDGGKLVVNEEEAETVRQIFLLYLDLRSLQATAAELNRRGWRTKSWATRDGTFHEGVAFNKAHLSRLLGNPLYVGRVSHTGEIYEGEHPGIVDEAIYDARAGGAGREQRQRRGEGEEPVRASAARAAALHGLRVRHVAVGDPAEREGAPLLRLRERDAAWLVVLPPPLAAGRRDRGRRRGADQVSSAGTPTSCGTRSRRSGRSRRRGCPR